MTPAIGAEPEMLYPSQNEMETGTVTVNEEYRLVGVTAQNYVVNNAEIMNAGFAERG